MSMSIKAAGGSLHIVYFAEAKIPQLNIVDRFYAKTSQLKYKKLVLLLAFNDLNQRSNLFKCFCKTFNNIFLHLVLMKHYICYDQIDKKIIVILFLMFKCLYLITWFK